MERQTVTAIDVDTALFFCIVQFLKESGWRLAAEYSPEIFDKSIYFDYYEFQKECEHIQMAWSIWEEGEIEAAGEMFEALSLQFQAEFEFGNGVIINLPHKKRDLLVIY